MRRTSRLAQLLGLVILSKSNWWALLHKAASFVVAQRTCGDAMLQTSNSKSRLASIFQIRGNGISQLPLALWGARQVALRTAQHTTVTLRGKSPNCTPCAFSSTLCIGKLYNVNCISRKLFVCFFFNQETFWPKGELLEIIISPESNHYPLKMYTPEKCYKMEVLLNYYDKTISFLARKKKKRKLNSV